MKPTQTKVPAAVVSFIKSLPAVKQAAAVKYIRIEFFDAYCAYMDRHGAGADQAKADRSAWDFTALALQKRFAA